MAIATLLFLVAALPGTAWGQWSQRLVLPADTSSAIKLSARVTQHWYESGKVHVFLMVDGFSVRQGNWTLRARDGVVWLDEGAVAPGQPVALGIYAEGTVTIDTGQPGVKATETESVYVTLFTSGDIERPAAGEREKAAERTPLYLRGKRVRADVLAAYRKGQGEKPEEPAEGTGTGDREWTATGPVGGGVAAPTARPREEVSVWALDEQREVKFETIPAKTPGEKGVAIWTGGVLVTYGEMELRADDVVIWAYQDKESREKYGEQAEAYLEGNVEINKGRQTIRASKAYYNFETQQALILDATIRSFSRARDVPVYYYAERVRQVAEGKFVATKATFTTSEMGHPHTAIHGDQFQIVDLSGRDPETGEIVRRGRFDATNVVSTVRGMPVSYWPRMAGDVEQGETALRRVNLTQQTNRGWGMESQWYLWKLLGIGEPPKGFQRMYLDVNFYGERGPYIAADGKYQRDDFFGEFLANYIYDYGEDRIGGEDYKVPRSDRGRVTARHRQYFWDYWEATAEVSYLSDENYLREWYEEEDEQGKDQETLLYVKRQEEQQAVSMLVKKRINNFLTQTESYPRVEHHLLAQPLADNRLTYYTTSVYMYGRYNADEDLTYDRLDPTNTGSPEGNVADTRHEVDYPFQVGFIKFVPFAEARASYFEETIDPRGWAGGWTREGSRTRHWEAGGLRASWYLWKVYDDVYSELWNVNRLRHISTFDVEALVANANVGSRYMYAYDEPGSAETKLVDGIDDTDMYRLRWRQRLQTKRGPEQRTVDWIMFDLLATFFSDKEQPLVSYDNDRVRNNVQATYAWQLGDTTSVVGDTYYETDHGTVRLSNIGLSVVRSPRLSYYIGSRYINGADSSIGTFGLDYIINRKWKFHFFEQYEFNGKRQNSGTRFEFTRRLDTWEMSVAVEVDKGDKENIFYVNFQPVGVPEFRVGN